MEGVFAHSFLAVLVPAVGLVVEVVRFPSTICVGLLVLNLKNLVWDLRLEPLHSLLDFSVRVARILIDQVLALQIQKLLVALRRQVTHRPQSVYYLRNYLWARFPPQLLHKQVDYGWLLLGFDAVHSGLGRALSDQVAQTEDRISIGVQVYGLP